jgi:hypothetical protein
VRAVVIEKAWIADRLLLAVTQHQSGMRQLCGEHRQTDNPAAALKLASEETASVECDIQR